MTNFLSPVDPLFFLHQPTWTACGRVDAQAEAPQPSLSATGQDLETLSNELFLFYVDGNGNPVGPAAGDYFSTERFEYITTRLR